MKKVISILLALLFLLHFDTLAKNPNPYKGQVTVDFEDYELREGDMYVGADVNISRLKLPGEEMMIFTPALRSLDGRYEIRFQPVIVTGSERALLIERAQKFDEYEYPQYPREVLVLSRNNRPGNVSFMLQTPYQRWMRHSRLVIVEQTLGCLNGTMSYADGRDRKIYAGNPFEFPPPHQPQFRVSYMTPPVDSVKIQAETYSARLNFQVNRSELLRNFGDNARILDEADRIIDRIKGDTLLTLRRVTVKGYASPEGAEWNNWKLSHDRARAFVTYIHWKHNFYEADGITSFAGMGEDWDGLRKAVETSYLPNKEEILRIIDDVPSANRRKSALKALAGGWTYQVMLCELYPPLRRNEYTLEYEIRGFSAREAATLIRTRPHLLNLNEMFLAANLYDHGSPEFREILDIAVRQFPDSPVAQFNAGVVELENGAYTDAVRRFSMLDMPEAWNYLGVAYWHLGEYGKAAEAFGKASEMGLEEGVYNLEEYRRWDADREDE